jgi:acetyltransferase-like isoleucine patch superfamily enzyme
VRLGARVHVHTWCAFNVEPEGRVAVGDDTTLVGAVVMCAERIEIGRGVLVSYNVTLADSDFHPLAVDARRRDAEACAPEGDRSGRPRLESAPVVVEDGAALGVGAIVLKGVVVGAGARVMAGAVVTHSVPPGAAVEGNPARPVSPGARGTGAA